MTRRDFYRLGTYLLGASMALTLAVPGVAYILDPLRRKVKGRDFHPLARLSELEVGVPRSFPIIEERRDAWVKYPREPVGSVWLVRQEGGKVLALAAECPHLGCAIGMATDRKTFFCPCHTSSFDFDGGRLNAVPPRGMDSLEVELSKAADPVVSVRFQRFQAQIREKMPRA